MLDLKLLETFLWVATTGNFRKAAARLNTTQPAVSQRIAALELTLGRRLFDRDRRRVALTEHGSRLLLQAQRILRLRDEIVSDLGDPQGIRSILRLGVAETIVHTWLPRFIERLSATYPHVELEIEVETSPHLTERLKSRDLQLAFILGPPSLAEVRTVPLCAHAMAFFASPALGLKRRRVYPADVLTGFPVITFAKSSRPYAELRDALAAKGLDVRIHASTSLATVVRMAIDGIGIAAIPDGIIHREVADGQLQRVRVDLPFSPMQFVACWPSAPDNWLAARLANLAAEVAGSSGPAR